MMKMMDCESGTVVVYPPGGEKPLDEKPTVGAASAPRVQPLNYPRTRCERYLLTLLVLVLTVAAVSLLLEHWNAANASTLEARRPVAVDFLVLKRRGEDADPYLGLGK